MATEHAELADIREHLRAMADPEGSYVLVCARTGVRPPPVDGLAFADRRTAANAVLGAEEYRDRLCGYDPRLPFHDLIVVER